jgi:peptide/nickel transport system permease protein
MTQYVLRRLVLGLILIWVVGSLVFLFVHVLPGDPAQIILGGSETRQPTAEEIEAVRLRLGLDKPIHVQYIDFITSTVQGDLGNSFSNDRPVFDDLMLRMGRTLQLILPAVVLSALIGILLGVVAATQRGTWLDTVISAVGIFGHSLPSFVTGTLLVLVLAIHLSVLPSSGYTEFTTDPQRFLLYLVLPLTTLTLGGLGPIMRMTRMTMVEQSGMDYARTARAKGLSNRSVTYRHILRNALVPVVTIVGLQLGSRFAGTVLVETIFNWPGVSSYLITGVTNRDYPVIQGTMIAIAAIFVLINLVTDLMYAVVDPRIRHV